MNTLFSLKPTPVFIFIFQSFTCFILFNSAWLRMALRELLPSMKGKILAGNNLKKTALRLKRQVKPNATHNDIAGIIHYRLPCN